MHKNEQNPLITTKRRRITRNRVIKSCRCCYHNKLKCDRKHPCGNCIARDTVNLCEYGFNKALGQAEQVMAQAHAAAAVLTVNGNNNNGSNNNGTRFSHRVNLDHAKVWKVSDESTVYKSKYFYPFFTSSINDKFLSTETYGKMILPVENLIRNEITKFNKYSTNDITTNEILDLFPTSVSMARSQIEIFFEWVYPIIPILNKERILTKLDGIYDFLLSSLSTRNTNGNDINLPDLLLIISIFFCSAYCNVASGIIPDLLLCNKYYAAFRHLLIVSEFPMRPQLESLQSYLLINFITDPNMVDATNYSTMLVRMAQQLGLHRIDSKDGNNKDLLFLWHYLLYVEGSASVVSGFPFSVNQYLIKSVSIPEIDSPLFNNTMDPLGNEIPWEYSIGRFKINLVFKQIMDSTLIVGNLDDTVKTQLLGQIQLLYINVKKLIQSMRNRKYTHAEYFISTLQVFLYRLHLRYYALDKIHDQTQIGSSINNDHNSIVMSRKRKRKINSHSQDHEPVQNKDITWILETTQDVKEDVIPLSLLLLLSTLKRLIQKNINNFAWYTRGSTVMQYLFVVLRDLYQNPDREYAMKHFNNPFKGTIDDDIREIITTSPLGFKLTLIEELLPLIELKLAPLWKKNDLYKFMLVKTVKNKVWGAHQAYWDNNSELKKAQLQLQQCRLFANGKQSLENNKSIALEDCLAQWGSDTELFEPDQILMDWIAEFN